MTMNPKKDKIQVRADLKAAKVSMKLKILLFQKDKKLLLGKRVL